MVGITWHNVCIAMLLLCLAIQACNAAPPTPPPAPPSQPEEIHLAYGDTRDSVTVSWATMGSVPTPVVRYGKTASLDHSVEGTSFAMNTSVDRTVHLHHVDVQALEAATTYYYTVGHVGIDVDVPPLMFHTRPTEGTQWSPRVVFFGDTGNSKQWKEGTVPAVGSEVDAKRVDAVVHTGDMAYYAKDDDGRQSDIHMTELAILTRSQVPLMACPGNAEVFCYRPKGIPAWGNCMLDYQARFRMPGWNRTHSLWSSFDIGPAHFLLLDSEAATWCGATQNQTEQRAFMEADLEEANKNRHVRPWIIAVIHRPLYSTYNSTGEQQRMRTAFADLILKYKVDVVLHGHVHSYERTWPVTGDYDPTKNATVHKGESITEGYYRNPEAPVYVVSGAGGNGESIDPFTGASYYWDFSVFRSVDIGYSSVVVHNHTHLEFDFYSVTQKKVIDHWWMAKGV